MKHTCHDCLNKFDRTEKGMKKRVLKDSKSMAYPPETKEVWICNACTRNTTEW